jgi:hypothetical protein
MGLSEEIEKTRKEIRTDGYPMSIGELLSMYGASELHIQPEFQRYFRWDQDQKSRLIESILLGIPLPSIFVSQRKDGVWEVIDGLQRLSTIMEFVGVLKDADGASLAPLTLSETKYLPSLGGKTWEGEQGFEKEQQLLFKRGKINVTIVSRESDPYAKFELFQRLNTGGSPLTAQEIRNCILMMENPAVLKWLRALSNHPTYRGSWYFTHKQLQEQYDLELIVRFIVFRKTDVGPLSGRLDLDFVLTENLLKMIKEGTLDMEAEEKAFKTTFDALHGSMGEKAFLRFYENKEEHQGRGLTTAFDLLAVAYGGLYESVDPPDFEAVKSVLNMEDFKQKTKAGTRAVSKLKVALNTGRAMMKP